VTPWSVDYVNAKTPSGKCLCKRINNFEYSVDVVDMFKVGKFKVKALEILETKLLNSQY